MFTKLLIANRGAIACRILRTLRTLNVTGVAVWSEADASSLHIRDADEAISTGDGPAAQTYLVSEKLLMRPARAAHRRFIPATVFFLRTPPLPKPAKPQEWHLWARRRNNCGSLA